MPRIADGRLMISHVDYGIVILMLLVSSGTGLYFGLWGGQKTTIVDYLFAGKSMSIFPVAFSLMATFMSATALVGLPAEMYLFGTYMAFATFGHLLGIVVFTCVFLPVYFGIEVSTSFEYLEMRFGPSSRKVLSGIALVSQGLYNGVVLYAPALALSAVTNISMWTSMISMGVICTFYSTIGGIKAVLWTDVFQAILMYTCLFVIITKGCLDLGGFSSIFSKAYEGGRLTVPTFKLDFSARYTMYSVVLFGLCVSLNAYSSSQAFLQRHLSLKTLKSSVIASLVSALLLAMFYLLSCLCGVVLFAYFKDCDPVSSPKHPIHAADQLLPYFIVQTLSQYPGLPGLCIAGIFSASLSTISSAVNSMAALTYEDFIKQWWPDPSKSLLITKAASAFYGVLSIFVAFLGSSLGSLIQANVVIVGTASGPVLGMFLLAVTTTTANEMGANLGVLSGFIVAACLNIIPKPVEYPTLPFGQNCGNLAETMFNQLANGNKTQLNLHEWQINDTILQLDASLTSLPTATDEVFPISYMWMAIIGLLTTIVVGYFSSSVILWFTGRPRNVRANLLCPQRRRFLSKCPAEDCNLKTSSVIKCSKL